MTVFFPGIRRRIGFGCSGHHVQVLRNHRSAARERRGLRPSVADADLDQNVAGAGFRVFDKYIKISIVIEYAGIEQLVFHVVATAPAVCLDQIAIGICVLRIFVEILHVGMGRRTIEIEIVFLDILAVIAFAVGQTEQPLLQDRILAVPQGDGKAQPLMVVAEAGEAILAPVIGARPRLVMAEIIPGIAVLAVIFAYRAPLTLAEIRSPQPPRYFALLCFAEAQFFGGIRFSLASSIVRAMKVLPEIGILAKESVC